MLAKQGQLKKRRPPPSASEEERQLKRWVIEEGAFEILCRRSTDGWSACARVLFFFVCIPRKMPTSEASEAVG